MPFAIGDRVHVQDLGTGEVREVRNGGRYVVLIKGRTLVVTASQMRAVDPVARGRRPPDRASPAKPAERRTSTAPLQAPLTLDLHGLTVEEAVAALLGFLNDALLAGAGEAQVIHGRSGGRLRGAVHAELKRLPAVRHFAIDPRNPGVTVVQF
jgi:dsDNA-specific endonuclease/ATPase MutS2